MNRRKPKPSLKQTIETNRAQMTGMAKLFGNDPPVFSELDIDKPKQPRAKKRP